MFVVIFEAETARLDEEYSRTAERLRKLAFENYNCQGFHSCGENGKELTLSFWKSEEDILNWRNDPEHILAQQKGKESWYSRYAISVSQIQREYEWSRS